MLRLAFDFIITWRETRTRPNAYDIMILFSHSYSKKTSMEIHHINGYKNKHLMKLNSN